MENIKKIIPKLEEVRELLNKLDKPLKFDEAAEYLGFSKSYLYKLTAKILIPHYKPSGRFIFFMKRELDEWIRTNQAIEGIQSAKDCIRQIISKDKIQSDEQE